MRSAIVTVPARSSARSSAAKWLVSAVLLALAASDAPRVSAQASLQGQWTTLPYSMPINPVHLTLLNNGRVLVVAGSGNVAAETNFRSTIWDPQAGTFSTRSHAWDMFCNGAVVLPDGRVLINGGNLQYDPFLGHRKNALYDPASDTFTDVEDMAHGRWYPTPTLLADGSVMTFSGLDELTGATNKAVEIYKVGSGWSPEYIASWTPPLYPRMHLVSDGRVFYSGSGRGSRFFAPWSHTWSSIVATTNFSGTRKYGTSVLLPLSPSNGYASRVMIFGGGNPATNTTEIIDLSAATKVWQWGPPMSQGRIEMNATILPNGKVLVMGGSVKDEDAATASLNADLYDPNTNTFSPAGANVFPRLYHSGSLLLPDGTVALMGGNPTRGSYEQHIEIYSPAYLFNGDGSPASRPTITSTPDTMSYGNGLQVQTPDAGQIQSVVLVRPGSQTHAFDMDQRLVELSFTTASGSLTVSAPPTPYVAPPGYYMLFVLNSAGVPSLARFVRLTGGTPANQAPTATITSPASNMTVNPGGAVSFAGSGADPDGTVAAYAWSFGGGSPAASSQAAPGAVTYATPGSYTASLIVTDNAGAASVAATRTITVADFSLTATPASRSVLPAAGTTYIATVAPITGFTGTVAFDVAGLPAGASASFTPASVASSGSTTLAVSTSASTPIGTHTLTINGTSGPITRSTAVTLVVAANQAPTATIASPASNVTVNPGGAVSFAGSGADPDGTVAAYAWSFGGGSPAASSQAAPGAVTYATPGSYTASLIVTDNAGAASVAATRTITVADFSLTATPASRSVLPAAGTTYIATVAPITGFTGTVAFDVAGLPAGASASFTPASVASSGSTTLAVSTSASTPIGTHTLTINGTSGPITRSTAVTLVVAANQAPTATIASPASNVTVNPGGAISFAGSGADPDGTVAAYAWSFGGGSPAASSQAAPGAVTYATPGSYTASLIVTDNAGAASVAATRTITVADFSLTATPASRSVLPAAGTTYIATVAPITGFTGTVGFDVAGLPAGASASFTPASVASSGSTTLAVATSAATPIGTYTLTINGTSGPITRTKTVTLVVAANQAPTATIASPASNVTVNPGGAISFAGSGADPDGTVASYAWSFAGGNPAASTQAAPGAVTYATPGSYSASLIVTDNAGAASVAATRTITVADFSLTATPASRSVLPAAGTTYAATVAPITGFTGTVGFDVAGLPAGASASFTPASVASSGTTTLAVATSAATPIGTYTLTINGTSGPITRTRTVTLVVAANQAPTATIASPASNVTVNPGGAISFAGSGADPDGTVASYAWSFAGGNPAASTQAAPGAVTYATPGSYSASLIVTDNAGAASVAATRTITVADFSLTATPASRSVLPAAGTTYAATVAPITGFTGTVGFDVAGLPAGASASFTPASVASSGTTTLAVATSAATPIGTYTLTINGTSGPITRTRTVTLVVAGSFSLSVSPSSRTVLRDGSTTYVVTLVPGTGFTGPVTFSISALPRNTTARFSPTSVTTSGTTTLTLDTKKNVARGTYALTVSGTSNGQVSSVPITLIIQ